MPRSEERRERGRTEWGFHEAEMGRELAADNATVGVVGTWGEERDAEEKVAAMLLTAAAITTQSSLFTCSADCMFYEESKRDKPDHTGVSW